ncbi:MAG: DUF4446 family protein [Ruminococcaceae bacterium]|nr:DUF4446 family protein [Oscillospiraceae bacterium]
MEKYFLYVFILFGILLIICFIIIYKLYKKVNKLQKKQLLLNDKLKGQSAEDLLYDVLRDGIEIKTDLKAVHREISSLQDKQSKCFDKVKIIRYHTAAESEAKLSYSVGLSNDNGDALVITGLQYRQGCNMYYKQVKEGIPDFELSQEEKCSIDRTNATDVIRKK